MRRGANILRTLTCLHGAEGCEFKGRSSETRTSACSFANAEEATKLFLSIRKGRGVNGSRMWRDVNEPVGSLDTNLGLLCARTWDDSGVWNEPGKWK